MVLLGLVDGSGPAPRDRDSALDRLVGMAHSGWFRCFIGKIIASDRCSGVYTVFDGPLFRNDCIDIGSVLPVEEGSLGVGVVFCLVRANEFLVVDVVVSSVCVWKCRCLEAQEKRNAMTKKSFNVAKRSTTSVASVSTGRTSA